VKRGAGWLRSHAQVGVPGCRFLPGLNPQSIMQDDNTLFLANSSWLLHYFHNARRMLFQQALLRVQKIGGCTPFLISLLCAARGGWKKLFRIIKKLKFGGLPSAKRVTFIYRMSHARF
jgi:hypothetical protein